MAEAGARTRLFEQLGRVGRALGSSARLLMVDLLAQRERSVDELAEAAGLSAANASQHLRALRAAGLVTARREGTRVVHRLAGEDVLRLWLALRDVAAARVADVERAAREYLGDDVEAVGRDELVARLRAGGVTLLDVRPEAEFAAGHIRGARSIPLAELEARMAEIPAGDEVVAYCRGPYCVYAHEAVRRLRARGRRARRLEGGWPEWRLAGLPVAAEARSAAGAPTTRGATP